MDKNIMNEIGKVCTSKENGKKFKIIDIVYSFKLDTYSYEVKSINHNDLNTERISKSELQRRFNIEDVMEFTINKEKFKHNFYNVMKYKHDTEFETDNNCIYINNNMELVYDEQPHDWVSIFHTKDLLEDYTLTVTIDDVTIDDLTFKDEVTKSDVTYNVIVE